MPASNNLHQGEFLNELAAAAACNPQNLTSGILHVVVAPGGFGRWRARRGRVAVSASPLCRDCAQSETCHKNHLESWKQGPRPRPRCWTVLPSESMCCEPHQCSRSQRLAALISMPMLALGGFSVFCIGAGTPGFWWAAASVLTIVASSLSLFCGPGACPGQGPAQARGESLYRTAATLCYLHLFIDVVILFVMISMIVDERWDGHWHHHLLLFTATGSLFIDSIAACTFTAAAAAVRAARSVQRDTPVSGIPLQSISTQSAVAVAQPVVPSTVTGVAATGSCCTAADTTVSALPAADGVVTGVRVV